MKKTVRCTRRAREGDLQPLMELLSAAVPDCAVQTIWELPWTWQSYYVAVGSHDAIIGAASLQDVGNARGEIRGLVVDKGWRGRGIAARLVRLLLARAKQTGVEAVCVTRNPEFFRRFGFTDTQPSWLRFERRTVATIAAAPRVALCLPWRQQIA